MWIEINNGVLILKLMKEKKFAQSQQAPPQQGGTSILEEFDNEIPHTTPNEALLYTLIKGKIKKNKKTDYLAR